MKTLKAIFIGIVILCSSDLDHQVPEIDLREYFPVKSVSNKDIQVISYDHGEYSRSTKYHAEDSYQVKKLADGSILAYLPGIYYQYITKDEVYDIAVWSGHYGVDSVYSKRVILKAPLIVGSTWKTGAIAYDSGAPDLDLILKYQKKPEITPITTEIRGIYDEVIIGGQKYNDCIEVRDSYDINDDSSWFNIGKNNKVFENVYCKGKGLVRNREFQKRNGKLELTSEMIIKTQ